MPYTRSYTVDLPSDLVEEAERWAILNNYERAEGIVKLIKAGLGKAVSLRPKAEKKREADDYIQRAPPTAPNRDPKKTPSGPRVKLARRKSPNGGWSD